MGWSRADATLHADRAAATEALGFSNVGGTAHNSHQNDQGTSKHFFHDEQLSKIELDRIDNVVDFRGIKPYVL